MLLNLNTTPNRYLMTLLLLLSLGLANRNTIMKLVCQDKISKRFSPAYFKLSMIALSGEFTFTMSSRWKNRDEMFHRILEHVVLYHLIMRIPVWKPSSSNTELTTRMVVYDRLLRWVHNGGGQGTSHDWYGRHGAPPGGQQCVWLSWNTGYDMNLTFTFLSFPA